MAWVRLDDQFFLNPKVVALSKDATLLYLAALTYASSQQTDGALAPASVTLVRGLVGAKAPAVAALVAAGLWEPDGDGYRIHDYLDYNPAAAQRDGKWRQQERRMALHKDAALRPTIHRRDGDQCRYCGVAVDWRDRRGPTGGAYDWVDPQGGDDPANIVTACRRCRRQKGEHPLAAVGMTLLPCPPSPPALPPVLRPPLPLHHPLAGVPGEHLPTPH